MRADSERPLPLPSSYPPESYVRARSGAVPASDIRTRAVLRREAERSDDAWLETVALVEHVFPLRDVDPSEPPPCAGCARCGHRKRETARARGRRRA